VTGPGASRVPGASGGERASIRVFAALPLPGEALARLERAAEELERRGRDFRVVRPEGMHVTLFFFGELEQERVSLLQRAMEAPAVGMPALEASLGGLGQFPPRGAARVLYCPVLRGGEEIAGLHRRLREALLAAWESSPGQAGQSGAGGRPPWDDRRPFKPHVTVARSRRGGGAPGGLSGLEEAFGFEQPATLDRLVLYQSILKPGGAEYRPLKTVRLSQEHPTP